MQGLSLGFIADHFNVVPIRANDKSYVIVYIGVLAQTKRLQRFEVEGFVGCIITDSEFDTIKHRFS